MLAGLLLGSKRGTIAVLLFVLLKVIGLSGTGGLTLLVIFLIVAVANVVIVDVISGSLGLMATVHFPMMKAVVYNFLFAPGDVTKALVAALVYWQAMKSTHMKNLLK